MILQAGNAAPSAGNLKSRKFVSITEAADIEFLIRYIFSRRIREERRLFANVPCILVICANLDSARKKYRRGRLYAIQDATLAGQNMMLMAHALGIGSCWIGQVRERQIVGKFGIDPDYQIVGLIALGYPLSNTDESLP